MLHYTWNKDWKSISFSFFILSIILYLQFLLAIPVSSSKGSKDSIEKDKEDPFALILFERALFIPVAWPGKYLAGPFFVPTNPS